MDIIRFLKDYDYRIGRLTFVYAKGREVDAGEFAEGAVDHLIATGVAEPVEAKPDPHAATYEAGDEPEE